jgi:hypothetical protein
MKMLGRAVALPSPKGAPPLGGGKWENGFILELSVG